jgi:hypothetical protein
MCGGGNKGPSSAELVQQEEAAKVRAQAEADRLKAARDLQQQKQGQQVLNDQAAMANADAARRASNRTLLAGLQSQEMNPATGLSGLEDPTSNSYKKAKRASLIGVL